MVDYEAPLREMTAGTVCKQEFQVARERAGADVLHVHADPVGEGDPRPSPHLPDARQAGRHVQALAEPAAAGLGLVARQRARPDQRHVASQHVPQLRQLVDAGPPQKTSDAA